MRSRPAGQGGARGRPANRAQASMDAAADYGATRPRGSWGLSGGGAQVGVALAGEVTLGAADVFLLGRAVLGARGPVGGGGGVGTHPGDHDLPQGVVGLAAAMGAGP